MRNIARWAHVRPVLRDPLETSLPHRITELQDGVARSAAR